MSSAAACGMRRRLRQAVDDRARHALGLQQVDPLALAARGKISSISSQQLRPCCSTRAALVAKRGSFTHSGWPSTPASFDEEPVVAGRDDDGARLRLERLERHHAVAARAMALGHDAGGAEARVVPLEPGQARLEQRGVHDAAAPGRRARRRARRARPSPPTCRCRSRGSRCRCASAARPRRRSSSSGPRTPAPSARSRA